MNNIVSNQNINQQVQNQQFLNNNYNQTPRNKRLIVKIFAIIGGIVVGIILLVIIIMSLVSATSNKLICKSNEGNITIMYNDNKITGYTASGISYDLDQQKSYANKVGIKLYLDEFSYWFKTNTTGSCSIKEK